MVITATFGENIADLAEWNINFTPATSAITLAPSTTAYGLLNLTGGLTTTQNVGIGTNNPTSTLHVVGNATLTGGLSLSNPIGFSYTTLPTFTENHIGYTAFGSAYISSTMTVGSTNTFSSISLGVGVWFIHAQVELTTAQTGTAYIILRNTTSSTDIGFSGADYVQGGGYRFFDVHRMVTVTAASSFDIRMALSNNTTIINPPAIPNGSTNSVYATRIA